MAISLDTHISHKKEIYSNVDGGRIPSDLKADLKGFPVTTINYYWLFLLSGIFEFLIGTFYPINLKTLYIPTPLIFAFLLNFMFFVLFADIVSKRFYVHQLIEDDVNRYIINSPSSVRTFKNRNGLLFLIFSILTLEIYAYVFLFLVTKEYLSHIQIDYEELEKVKK
jgi:hypothetical protein